ncbi:MAG: aminotransferase class I/II-fold pyridoxal phosphate-dependent enzyme [Candidatus Obscuribacterales bacterium]|nr:aminotransferase class I/II-fold pyridoxal phosphate-dependent enzyme [Candidatus Obscuribacterales bacterium]
MKVLPNTENTQDSKTRTGVLPKKIVLELPFYDLPGSSRQNYARLDFCENTQGYPESYPQGMPEDWTSRYPEYPQFVEKLAAMYGVRSDSLILTNGSDEGIMVVCNTFIEPGEDTGIVSRPCFSVIPHSLRLAGAKLVNVDVLPDLNFDLDGIETALDAGAKIAFFATPENPTGAQISADVIESWCKKYPNTLIVIDEAYGDFSNTTVIPLIEKYDNLLVLRTFSKAWAMAGLRLGCIFGQPRMIDYLRIVTPVFSVNNAALWTANQLIDRCDDVKSYVAEVNERKVRLVEALEERSFEVINGAGNSILLSLGILADKFCQFCKEEKVLVRNRSRQVFPAPEFDPMWGRIRVSIGSQAEQDLFLATLDKFRKSYGIIFDLDGTLVDTSASFDETVAQMVERYSGKPLKQHELRELREEGGYNDDWVASIELLKRRGVTVSMREFSPEATKLYLSLAPKTEKLLLEVEALRKMAKRFPIFIVTGRTRAEYDPVWGERLNPLFERVYCLDDIAGLGAKPSPDYLNRNLADFDLKYGVYVGNSVDDMGAALAAGIDRIAITTSACAEALKEAGAQLIIDEMSELEKVFQL